MSTDLFLLIATAAVAFYIWQRRKYSYWQKLGIKYITPSPFFGNVRELLTGKVSFFHQIYKLHTSPGYEQEPLVGVYLMQRPGLLIRDLDLIKRIMIKEFSCFSNRVLQADPHHDPLGYNNLFFIRNPEWKELRTKLSPVFSSGKIKQMYPLMVAIGQDLEKSLTKVPVNSVVKIKDLCARFTTDLIGTIAFGVRANALSELKSEFFESSKAIFDINWRRGVDVTIIFLLPSLVSLARVKVFSKQTSNFIKRSINHVLEERERSGEQRNDLIDTLLRMKREANLEPEKGKTGDVLNDFLVAQAAIFQTAGFETSSSTMTLTLHELALNLNIQDRLREEILEYFGEEQSISYERIQEMPFLTQVVNETLRKYPIVGYAERQCTQPTEGKRFSLAPHYDLELPNGTPIYVSTLGIHRDEQYWPEPDKYDPDRWASESRKNLNMDAYMPFGIGPHNCIGMRLGLLQTKLGLVHLLRNHRVIQCEKTIENIEFAPLSGVMTPKSDVLLRLERCTN
ncbi:probable cytochrome P450 6w1 [Scaptodrosophila lebanonensis]|uniref:Probable cytochrome P450 6w1 n=1 Tax=Drosophila lebanonensis TaxID=7225 RepID=A0A6J2TI67_DROLE|nr:probable cytochrome P450 6w1 [Scaptodrosophila lebanonensis]